MTTKKYLNSLIPPLKGYFVEESTGKKLGEHTGFWQFTIGQRKGIGLAAPEALYVTSIDAATNTVYVGYKDKLFSDKLFLKNVNWNYPINKQKFESMVKMMLLWLSPKEFRLLQPVKPVLFMINRTAILLAVHLYSRGKYKGGTQGA